MTDNLAQALASHSRAFVIAPAGCGKTELIVRAVKLNGGKRQLILTHTHAGVKSLRDRMKRLDVSLAAHHVTTIASFCLRYTTAYPKTSGLSLDDEDEPDWEVVYEAAGRLFCSSLGKKIVRQSYTGIYVDEYQDCTASMHAVINALSTYLPCRIVGDYLQGIFGFANTPQISWAKDIAGQYERLPSLATPWRWKNTGNERLGTWLGGVRESLKKGSPIDLRKAPTSVEWVECTRQNQIRVCLRLLAESNATVIAMHAQPNQAHNFARGLGGRYSSMDEVEGKDLIGWARLYDTAHGIAKVKVILDFSVDCLTGASTELKTIIERASVGSGALSRGLRKHGIIATTLECVAAHEEPDDVLDALARIRNLQACGLFRPELWYDFSRALREQTLQQDQSMEDVAHRIRERKRLSGRTIPPRCVSRVLLIKGLEFDHAVVLNADDLDAKQLYVAMTRGSRSLTVLSSCPVIVKKPPFEEYIRA